MKYHGSSSDFCWLCWPRGRRTLVTWYRIISSKGRKNFSWTERSVIQRGGWMFLGLRVWGSAVHISLILLSWFWGSQQCGWSLTLCDMCLGAMSRIAELQMLIYWWAARLLLAWLALRVSLRPFCKNALSRPVLWLHHLSQYRGWVSLIFEPLLYLKCNRTQQHLLLVLYSLCDNKKISPPKAKKKKHWHCYVVVVVVTKAVLAYCNISP